MTEQPLSDAERRALDSWHRRSTLPVLLAAIVPADLAQRSRAESAVPSSPG